MELKNRTLSNFAELVETGECKKFRGRLKTGIDLGTANTVLAVVDRNNRPIAGISAPSHAIQDGVIVNYYESVQLVTKLKNELEEKLGTELTYGAAAIPPGVSEGSVKSIGYVLEGAGFEVTNIVDEPTAAAAVLKITDGAVVDVGGGTTGISILKDGKVIYTDDEKKLDKAASREGFKTAALELEQLKRYAKEQQHDAREKGRDKTEPTQEKDNSKRKGKGHDKNNDERAFTSL